MIVLRFAEGREQKRPMPAVAGMRLNFANAQAALCKVNNCFATL